MHPPLFIVISGAGGVGKNTIRDGLLRRFPKKLVSVQKITTRARRSGEGNEFRFVSRAEFARLVQEGALLEHMEFAGNWYGTPRTSIDAALAAGRSPVIIYDADGARAVRKTYPGQIVWIYVTAPEADLRRRMAARGDTPERIQERLRLAPKRESPKDGEADLVVDNRDGQLDQTIAAIAEFLRVR